MKITQIDDSEFEVFSDSGNTYIVRYEGSGDMDPDYGRLWSCDCPSYRLRGKLCKHINAVVDFVDKNESATPKGESVMSKPLKLQVPESFQAVAKVWTETRPALRVREAVARFRLDGADLLLAGMPFEALSESRVPGSGKTLPTAESFLAAAAVAGLYLSERTSWTSPLFVKGKINEEELKSAEGKGQAEYLDWLAKILPSIPEPYMALLKKLWQ